MHERWLIVAWLVASGTILVWQLTSWGDFSWVLSVVSVAWMALTLGLATWVVRRR